jgi:hypothetical protein
MTLRNKEFWGTLESGKLLPLKLAFLAGVSGLPRLDQLASLFELYKLKYCRLFYVPAISGTCTGLVHMGVDYEPSDSPLTISEISTLRPSLITQVAKSGELLVSLDRVMKGKTWLPTSSKLAGAVDQQQSFAVSVIASGVKDQTVGEIWIDYEVEFTSPFFPPTHTFAQMTQPPIDISVFDAGLSAEKSSQFLTSGSSRGLVSSLSATNIKFLSMSTGSKIIKCRANVMWDFVTATRFDGIYRLIVSASTSDNTLYPLPQAISLEPATDSSGVDPSSFRFPEGDSSSASTIDQNIVASSAVLAPILSGTGLFDLSMTFQNPIPVAPNKLRISWYITAIGLWLGGANSLLHDT